MRTLYWTSALVYLNQKIKSKMYSVGQLVALGLLGGLLVPVTAALTLWYAHKRAQPDQKGGTRSRAHLLYRALAGVLLGQVLCHAWLPVRLANLDTHLLFLCILLGYLLMEAGEALARVWHHHSHYVTTVDDTGVALEDTALNRERMEEQHVVSFGHLRAPNLGEQLWSLLDKEREEHKRQWLLGALFIALSYVMLTDSLLLIVLETADAALNDLLIMCFYVNAFTLSLALLGGMVHAKFHLTAGGRLRRWLWWWGVAGLGWSGGVLVLGVGLPLWLQAEPSAVLALLGHPAFLTLYGLVMGVLLKLHVYYYSRRLDPCTTRRDIGYGLIAFGLAAGQAALTSFWL
jgi:hypothetical protein